MPTFLDGCLSPAFDRVLTDIGRAGDKALDAELDLALWRIFDDDVDGFVFLSSSAVAESTDTVNGSSAVDSHAAGFATSPPPHQRAWLYLHLIQMS